MKKVFLYLERGLAIGFLVTTVCLLLNEGANETMRQVAVWMVASMLYGAVSLVFEADAIPLPAATALHLALCSLVTIAASYILGYADGLLSLLVYVFPTFLAIYAVIYLSIFLSIWISARRMNRKFRAR